MSAHGQPPSIDAAEYPSIAIPLGTTTGIDTHSHPQHQLTWASDGALTMEAKSIRWVLQRSRALWLPGGTLHAILPSTGFGMLSLYFSPADTPIGWREPTVVDATGLVGPLLTYLAGLPGNQQEQRRRGNAVLWDLLRPMPVTVIPTALPTDPTARRVALGIKERPDDKRSLAEWGRHVGASGRTLSRRFRGETGVSFEQWRTLVRLDSALPLLAAGMPVASVAHRVGYTTASAFVAAFHREIGTTPAAYFSRGGGDTPAADAAAPARRSTDHRR